jgi:signal transduction histidine kinase
LRKATLTISSVEPRVDVWVDRQLLAAATANLLQNAFKFTRPRGHVSLRVRPQGPRFWLSISREIVEASGGEIRMRDLPGIGCVMTLDLPRLAPSP